MWRRNQRVMITMLLLGLAGCIVFAMMLTQSGFAAPTGAAMIGRTTLRWIDSSRSEVMTDDPGDRREVVAHVWYPAQPQVGARRAPYVPDLDMLGPALAAGGEVSAFARFGLRFVRTHALVDAAVSSALERYPLLIFSPGNATNASFYTVLIEELVSHGYVVAAIDHPYDVAAVRLTDGRVAAYAEGPRLLSNATPRPDSTERQVRIARERVAERARDAIFVLDQLVLLNGDAHSRFVGRLDLQRVGIFGHSLGGMTVGDACRIDQRFMAGLNLDGLQLGQPFYLANDGRAAHQPFMLVTKAVPEASTELLARVKMTRAAWQERQKRLEQALQSTLRGMPGGGYRVIIQGAGHGDFTDVPQLAPALFSDADDVAARRLSIIASLTRSFFDLTLLDRPAPLLNGALQGYPEVIVERYGPA